MSSVKRYDIQYLRAFAVLLVLVFHSRAELMPNAYLGVDIFFCITGFVLYPQIASIYKNGTTRIMLDFWVRRYRRLYPAFLLCTSVCVVTLLIFAGRHEHQSIGMQALSSIFFVGNLGAENLHGNYFNSEPNPLLHYWSLSAEWQIYILVPLLMIVARTYLSLKVFLFTIGLISFLCQIILPPDTFFTDYYSPFSRLWQFSVGLTLAGRIHCKPALSTKFDFRFFGISLLLGTLIVAPFTLPTLIGQVLSVCLFVSLILANSEPLPLIHQHLIWIGDRSYSIYLWHLPALYLARYSPLSASQIQFRIYSILFALFLVFYLADVTHRKIELSSQSLKSYAKRKTSSFRKLLTSIIISLLTVFSSIAFPVSATEKAVGAWKSHVKCVENRQGFCELYSFPSEKIILVIGDSHSQQYFNVFEEIGESFNSSIMYLNANVSSLIYNQTTRDALRQTDYETIVISEFHSDTTQLKDFRLGLDFLRDLRVPIVFVGDNPVFLDFVEYRNYLHPSWFSMKFNSEPVMQVPMDKIDLNRKHAGFKYKEIAETLNLIIVDPFRVLCDGKFCQRKIGGKYLYYDDNHLSTFGARLLTEAIYSAVLVALTNEKSRE